MIEPNRAETAKTQETNNRSRRRIIARKTGATAAKRTTPAESNRVETGKTQERNKHLHHGAQQRTKPRQSWIYLTPISPAVKSRARVSPARRDVNGQIGEIPGTRKPLSTPNLDAVSKTPEVTPRKDEKDCKPSNASSHANRIRTMQQPAI